MDGGGTKNYSLDSRIDIANPALQSFEEPGKMSSKVEPSSSLNEFYTISQPLSTA